MRGSHSPNQSGGDLFVSDHLSGLSGQHLHAFDRPRHFQGAWLVQRVVTRCAHAHLLFCKANPSRGHYCLCRIRLSTGTHRWYFVVNTVYTIKCTCCRCVCQLVNIKLRYLRCGCRCRYRFRSLGVIMVCLLKLRLRLVSCCRTGRPRYDPSWQLLTALLLPATKSTSV